jgi:hypothetical protein
MSNTTVATNDTVTGTIVATNTSDATLRESAWEAYITADGADREAKRAYAASLADLDADTALQAALNGLADSAKAWAFTARMVATMEADGLKHKDIALLIDPTVDVDRTNTTLYKRIGRYANGGRLVIAAPTDDAGRLAAFREFGNHESKALTTDAAAKLRKSPGLDLAKFRAADAAAREQAKRDKAAVSDAANGETPQAPTNGAESADDTTTGTETRQAPRSAAGEPVNPANGATATAGERPVMPVVTLDMLSALTDSAWSAVIVTVLGSADDGRRAHLTAGQRVSVVKALSKALTAFGADDAKRDAVADEAKSAKSGK